MADGRYYWLKLRRDFFKRHDVAVLEAFPNGKEILLLYVKLLCESVDHDGRLRFSDEIPYTPAMLAAVTRTDPEIVTQALGIFRDFGLLEIMEDGTLYMSKIEDMVGSESAEARKKREQRERTKDKEGTNGGQCPDNVPTMSDRDKSIEYRDKSTEKKKEKEAQAPSDLPDIDPAVIPAFRDYVQMRVKIRAPMTDKAKALAVSKLKKLAADPAEQIEILNQSTMNSWKGIFPLKEETKEQRQRPRGTFYAFTESEHTRAEDEELERKLLRRGRRREG